MNAEIETLLRALDDPLPVIRTAAAQELGKNKVKQAVDKLIQLLEKDQNPLVRDNVAFALGEIGDNRAVPHLIKALKDSDEWVRKSAAKALSFLDGTPAADDLITLLQDISPAVRKTAARTLGVLGIKKALPEIEKLLNDENILVRKYAAMAVEKLRNLK